MQRVLDTLSAKVEEQGAAKMVRGLEGARAWVGARGGLCRGVLHIPIEGAVGARWDKGKAVHSGDPSGERQGAMATPADPTWVGYLCGI